MIYKLKEMAMNNDESDLDMENYWKKQLDRNAKGYGKRITAIKNILLESRGYVQERPIGEIAILLLSGGMDSVALANIAIEQWDCRLILLHFRRDSRNEAWEEEAVLFFHEFFKTRYPENILELVVLEIQIPSRINKEYLESSRKRILGLPMRNATMWANATTQAIYLSGKYNEEIRTVLVGSVADDLDNPESGPLSVLSQTLHTCIALGTWSFQFLAPLVDDSFKPGGFTKRELVDYCRDRGVPLERSRSCFGEDRKPCGTCLACENRARAFSTT